MLVSLLLFVVLVTAVCYRGMSLATGSLVVLAGAVLLTFHSPGMWLLLLATLILSAILNVPQWRRAALTAPVYARRKAALPPMSSTEREALEAGTTWREKDLFSGAPDWDRFASITPPRLTDAEQSFLDDEVESLC